MLGKVNVFVSYCYRSIYDKLSGLKQHSFLTLQFYRSEVQAQWRWVLCSRSYRLKTVSTELQPYLESRTEDLLPSLFRLLAEFIPLQLYNWGPCCFASCEWGTTLTPRGYPHIPAKCPCVSQHQRIALYEIPLMLWISLISLSETTQLGF